MLLTPLFLLMEFSIQKNRIILILPSSSFWERIHDNNVSSQPTGTPNWLRTESQSGKGYYLKPRILAKLIGETLATSRIHSCPLRTESPNEFGCS